MKNVVWQKAIASSAVPERARHYFERLKATRARAELRKASSEQARVLAALFSGSQVLSELLIAHPEWLTQSLNADLLRKPRQKQGFRRETEEWVQPLLQGRDYAGALTKLREFKQREMFRIGVRDLGRLGNVAEITRELSDVADVCLAAVYRLCRQQLTDRLGQPYHQDLEGCWQPTGFCVFGMGKLGGQELNYSSDVDLIFVYGEEGFLFKEEPRKSQASGKGLTNHQFFVRLVEAFIAEVTRLTPAGSLYRVDLRLRPEGASGPLARSLASYENFYAQWGQTWERMMLIKARCVAGDEALASEFLEMIQPFRYPRSIGERVLKEIASMKERIERDVVKAGEIDRNVKLGRGGIREIEFVAQTLQTLQAGRIPFLQDSQTLPALQKLVRYRLLDGADASDLSHGYCFLRDIEHRLQMQNDLQTHTLPTEREPRRQLAALMGFATLTEFEAALSAHTGKVRRVYSELLRSESAAVKPVPDFAFQNEWRQILTEHRFRDVERAYHLLQEFVRGPGYVHVSPRTSELAEQLVHALLSLCPKAGHASQTDDSKAAPLSDPDRVLARLDSFVTAYGSRAMLYETWTSNPSLFQLLLLLFDRSEFLAEVAIRTPDLVDELEQSGHLRRKKSAPEILRELRHGLNDADQRLWLRRYHQAELMRIGLRDILGLADFEQNLVELSALADACLQYASESVLRKHRMRKCPFAIVGLGKLGGQELNYGSDLDILFVADARKNELGPWQRLAAEIMDLLSSPTELGVAFATDARLRPDGEKGLLVNTLSAHEEYYRQRAQLWEIQALSRARAIADPAGIGQRFQTLAVTLSNFQKPSLPLAAYTPDWKAQVHQMRMRIEKERTPVGLDHLAIKTGSGGLMDAEFIAQVLCLGNGWAEPNTLRALQLAQKHRVLEPDNAEALIDNYRALRRIEGVLRRWSFAGETVLPNDPAPLYRVAVRCGFRNADNLMQALVGFRAALRAVYLKVMSAAR